MCAVNRTSLASRRRSTQSSFLLRAKLVSGAGLRATICRCTRKALHTQCLGTNPYNQRRAVPFVIEFPDPTLASVRLDIDLFHWLLTFRATTSTRTIKFQSRADSVTGGNITPSHAKRQRQFHEHPRAQTLLHYGHGVVITTEEYKLPRKERRGNATATLPGDKETSAKCVIAHKRMKNSSLRIHGNSCK